MLSVVVGRAAAGESARKGGQPRVRVPGRGNIPETPPARWLSGGRLARTSGGLPSHVKRCWAAQRWPHNRGKPTQRPASVAVYENTSWPGLVTHVGTPACEAVGPEGFRARTVAPNAARVPFGALIHARGYECIESPSVIGSGREATGMLVETSLACKREKKHRHSNGPRFRARA